jgi:hypothetical protein
MSRKFNELNAAEIRKLALKHNRSADKKKHYGLLVRKYGRKQASKITSLASYIYDQKWKAMRRKKLKSMGKKRITTVPGKELRKLGKEMREIGYSGSLTDYPTVQDRKAWIRGAAPYRYDLNNNPQRRNPGKGTSVLGALILGGIIGHSMKK